MQLGMQTLTLAVEDEGGKEEGQSERLGPVGLSWCENQHLRFSVTQVKSLENNRFTNVHQSMPDLSFFTSSDGRLAGGEAGRGA